MDDGYQAYNFSTLLTEPIGVNELIKELTEHTFLLWWDEREQQINFDTLLPRAPEYGPFSDSMSFLSGSVSVKRMVEQRISRLYFFYGHRSPVFEMDESKHFERIEVNIDYTEFSNKCSRWVPKGLRAVASEITTRIKNEYKDTKDVVSFTMDPKDDDAWTGSTVRLITRQVVDDFGEQKDVSYRVLKAAEKYQKAGVVYEYIAHSNNDVGRLGVITPDLDPNDGVSPFPDYNVATEELKARYAFIAPDSGQFSDGTEAYVIR